ncbi:hypothetical protein CEXT_194021 [Caerostris extrusa]|uniref:Uncharacterized protein n=1 Tax=Caerostris extrusa TaxID=172846 RepID=A0AAV4VQV2_CAEEX|nr:hypothetical protein CEXT_194021 [Caerostris extrusa]
MLHLICSAVVSLLQKNSRATELKSIRPYELIQVLLRNFKDNTASSLCVSSQMYLILYFKLRIHRTDASFFVALRLILLRFGLKKSESDALSPPIKDRESSRNPPSDLISRNYSKNLEIEINGVKEVPPSRGWVRAMWKTHQSPRYFGVPRHGSVVPNPNSSNRRFWKDVKSDVKKRSRSVIIQTTNSLNRVSFMARDMLS